MFERVLRWLVVGGFCSTVATCGQKGPLELPDERAARPPVAINVVLGRGPAAGPMCGEPDGVCA